MTLTHSPKQLTRWTIVIVGLILQVFVLITAIVNVGRPQSVALSLAPVSGDAGVCRVVAVQPYSNVWVQGIRAGMEVRITDGGQLDSCKISGNSVLLRIVALPPNELRVTVVSPPVDFILIATNLILALIFSVTSLAIFLRVDNRPVARITYALFYCIVLAFCMLRPHNIDVLWLNLLSFVLSMLMRGLAATLVLLFALSSVKQHRRYLSYLPLFVAIVLIGVDLLVPDGSLRLNYALIAINFVFSVGCLLTVVVVMIRGLRHLDWQERQFVRMVVIGIIFLLFPLALEPNLVSPGWTLQDSLVRLIPIPLAVLPLACNYALFRTQLLGTTSLISRQVMRALLWVLLACTFIFSAIMLLHAFSALPILRGAQDYVFAALLLVCLALFPRVWNKVRDVGDQVFYRDFYQYNRSLRDISAALVRLRGMKQISTFMLPRLAVLLNATEASLLLRPVQAGRREEEVSTQWQLYRQRSTLKRSAGLTTEMQLADDQLVKIAELALTHVDQDSSEPLLLDGMLLLALYDGSRCSGFLCLGPKWSQEPYSRQDRSFLSTLASQLSVLEVNSRYLEQAQADAQQMAALNHRVISAQEEERRHLALELHDEALQQAMLVVRQLSDAGTMEEVAEAMPLARSIEASLRRTCLKLRPPLLDELGLEEALSWLARQTEERGELRVRVESIGKLETRPAANVELALYRVGQEALSNVFKYARANQAVIRLRYGQDGAISLLVSDNGRGLPPKRQQAESLGLVGMHERMVAIGGTLQLHSSPGRGVTIRAVCPPLHSTRLLLNVPERETSLT